MMKKYAKNFKGYLDSLASRMPSPGGGSVVALASCLGISLIGKAMIFSSLKPERFKRDLKKLHALRKKIYPYIDKDAIIFAAILKTKGKKRLSLIRKSEKIILDTAKASIFLFSLAKRAESGIKNSIISDFHIGCNLIKVSLSGCIANLEANKRIFKRENPWIKTFKAALKQWERF